MSDKKDRPDIRRVMPNVFASDDIVGVSPMKAPNMDIHKLRAMYDKIQELK